MANVEDLNALMAAAENSSASQQLVQLLLSSAIVRAQRLKSIQTNLGSLFNLCGHDDPDKLENSTYGFDLGLTRMEKDHITTGLILITPGKLLSSGTFDERSFGEQDLCLRTEEPTQGGNQKQTRILSDHSLKDPKDFVGPRRIMGREWLDQEIYLKGDHHFGHILRRDVSFISGYSFNVNSSLVLCVCSRFPYCA